MDSAYHHSFLLKLEKVFKVGLKKKRPKQGQLEKVAVDSRVKMGTITTNNNSKHLMHGGFFCFLT
jgi:hypothetical protein